jgi:hypothetical protein
MSPKIQESMLVYNYGFQKFVQKLEPKSPTPTKQLNRKHPTFDGY